MFKCARHSGIPFNSKSLMKILVKAMLEYGRYRAMKLIFSVRSIISEFTIVNSIKIGFPETQVGGTYPPLFSSIILTTAFAILVCISKQFCSLQKDSMMIKRLLFFYY